MYNGHADVTALIDAGGTIQATYYYDAFGNILESTGTADNPFKYAGYQYDDETGLYYLQSRYYDPLTARFITEDTYRGTPNDPLSLNLYTYCHNEPLMYTDPDGHSLKSIIKKATTAVKKAATTVKKAVTSAPSNIKKSATNIASNAKQTAANIKKAVAPVVKKATTQVKQAVTSNPITKPYAKPLSVAGSFVKGEAKVAKDTVVGLFKAVSDLKTTGKNLVNAVKNYKETGNAIKNEIKAAYKKDVVNGNANSRELPDGTVVRKDGVGITNSNDVRIIKPDTPSGRAAAEKRADLMTENGYNPTIDYYNPADPRFQPGSPTYIGPRK